MKKYMPYVILWHILVLFWLLPASLELWLGGNTLSHALPSIIGILLISITILDAWLILRNYVHDDPLGWALAVFAIFLGHYNRILLELTYPEMFEGMASVRGLYGNWFASILILGAALAFFLHGKLDTKKKSP